jgi:anthranilate synthase component 1
LKTVRTGEGFDVAGDPLVALEEELEPYRYVKLPQIPTFTGKLNLFVRVPFLTTQAALSASSHTTRSPISSR